MQNVFNIKIALAIIVFICSCISAYAQTDPQVKMPPVPGGSLHYWRYLPPDYNQQGNTQKYPLMIFLHGIGERADYGMEGDPDQMKKVKENGPPMEIKSGSDMCFIVNGTRKCFIVLSPQLVKEAPGQPTRTQWGGEPASLVKYYVENYRIDTDRIYITGLSMGGIGVIDYAQNTVVYPYTAQIAAIGVAPGGQGDVTDTKECLLAQRKIPMWAAHVNGDPTDGTPYSHMVAFVNEVNNNCTPSPFAYLTTLPVVDNDRHDAWTRYYKTDHSHFLPNVYEWFLMNPKTIVNHISPHKAGVYAGPDRTITTTSVTLQGEGKDNDGGTVTYSWSKINGGTATITNGNTPNATVTGLSSGTYVFRLQVTDDDVPATTSTDEVTITVNLSTNNPPVANAGADKVINLPTSSATLAGSGSDAEGPVTFAWSKRSGPSSYTFASPTSAVTTVSNLVYGVYTFRLTVRDNAGVSRFDDIKVTVNPTPIAGKKTWYSWNMDTQSGASQPGVIISDVGGLEATLEFYESTNNFGVAKAGLFPHYQNSIHPDPGTRVAGYWASSSGPAGDGRVYTYVGKSIAARGEEPGETGIGAPAGAFDVQMHPPDNDHQTVAAFIVPEAGSYWVNNLGVRRVSEQGGTVEFKVYDPTQQQRSTLTGLAGSQAWNRSGTGVNLGFLTAGQRIYFAVERDGDYYFDMTEVSFSVTSTTATSAASADQEVVIMDEVLPNEEVQEYKIAIYDGQGIPLRHFTTNATPSEIRSADFRNFINYKGLYIFRITNNQNRTEVRKIIFHE